MSGFDTSSTRIDQLVADVGLGRVKSPLEKLASRRFYFVTGKGGVGKTTVCAALSLALAARGKKVLVAMCNTKERLSALLGSAPIGDKVVQVSENVWAVNMVPETAVYEYGEMVLKSKTVTNALFGNKYVQAFFRAVPGLHEWTMLGKAWFHTTETDKHDAPRFDVVLLDAPATGHGLDMLRVPKVILDVVPPGVLRRDAERAWALFTDPARAGVIVVTLPEELPVTETEELVTALDKELGLPLAHVVVNGVLPPLFDQGERARLGKAQELLAIHAPETAKSGERAVAVAGARRAVREEVQVESLKRLQAFLSKQGGAQGASVSWLPFLFEEASTKRGTELLANELLQRTVIGR